MFPIVQIAVNPYKTKQAFVDGRKPYDRFRGQNRAGSD